MCPTQLISPPPWYYIMWKIFFPESHWYSGSVCTVDLHVKNVTENYCKLRFPLLHVIANITFTSSVFCVRGMHCIDFHEILRNA